MAVALSIVLATRVVVLLELTRQSKIVSRAVVTSALPIVTSKSLRTPYLPISACKPPSFFSPNESSGGIE